MLHIASKMIDKFKRKCVVELKQLG